MNHSHSEMGDEVGQYSSSAMILPCIQTHTAEDVISTQFPLPTVALEILFLGISGPSTIASGAK